MTNRLRDARESLALEINKAIKAGAVTDPLKEAVNELVYAARMAGARGKPEGEKFYLNTDHIELIPVKDFKGFSVVTDNPKTTKKRKGDKT